MSQQSNDKLFSRLKNKLKKQQFTTLPDYPSDRCAEPPERCELQLAMKFLRRRRINMKKKYRAVLENGTLELHHPKQKELNGFTIEYRVDLAKVLLLYDEHRLVVKLQTEVLLLYPVTVTVDRLRDVMHQHRLWSQEKMTEKNAARSTTDTGFYVAPCVSEGSGMDSVLLTTDSEPSGNPIQDFLRETHAMSLAILDASSHHLEQMRLVVEEVKGLVEQLKKNKRDTPKPPVLPVPPSFPAVPTVAAAPPAKVALATKDASSTKAALPASPAPPAKDAPAVKNNSAPKDKKQEDEDDDEEDEEEEEEEEEKK